MLPKPKSKFGYSEKEIEDICRSRKVTMRKFWSAFGVNTCAIEKGETRYYCGDVERALYRLGTTDGIYHEWD